MSSSLSADLDRFSELNTDGFVSEVTEESREIAAVGSSSVRRSTEAEAPAGLVGFTTLRPAGS